MPKRPRPAEGAVPAAADDGDAEDFEAAPRRGNAAWMDSGSTRLPIKLADGSVKLQAGRPVVARAAAAAAGEGSGDEEEDDEEEDGDYAGSDADGDSDEDEDEDGGGSTGSRGKARREGAPPGGGIAGGVPALTYTKLARLSLAQVLARRAAQQARIAELSERIISYPEMNVSPPTAGKEKLQLGKPGMGRTLVSKKQDTLRALHAMCGDGDPVVRRLAILSCVAVFKDIAPAYRIRAQQATGGGSDVKLKKEVRKLREYEAALLGGYQRFLRYLEFTVVQGERAERRTKRRAARGLPPRAGGAAAGGGGGADDGDDAASVVSDGETGSRFDVDKTAGGGGGADDDDSDAEENDDDADGGKRRERVSLREFNASRMQGKRAAKAARDQTTVYDADDGTVAALGLEALKGLGSLLVALPHFNFRSNIIALLVPRAATAAGDASAAAAAAALGELFLTDTALEATVEAVNALGEAVKGATSRPGGLGRLRPAAVETLLRLRLGVLERTDREARGAGGGGGKGGGKDGGKHVKREGMMGGLGSAKTSGRGAGNKDPYDRDDVMAGLRLADAESLAERQARTKAALRGAVAIYFRVLRSPSAHSSGAHLLGPTLAGLGRIGHLIDVGVVSDLLAALKGLLAASTGMAQAALLQAGEGAAGHAAGGVDDSDDDGAGRRRRVLLPPSVAFNAVLSALRIMSGPGESVLNADETEFAHFLYGSLLRLGGRGDEGWEGTLPAVSAVGALLLARREVSHERVASFVKRLLFVALPAPPHAALALLSCARALLHRYGAVASALLGPPTERSHAAFGAGAAAVGGGGSGGPRGIMPGPSASGKKGGASGASSSSSSATADAIDLSAAVATLAGGDPLLAGLVTGARGALYDSDGCAHAMAGTAWELAALARHYHPAVAAAAVAAAKLAPLGPADAPEAVFAVYRVPFSAAGDVHPPPPAPRPQPYQLHLQQQAAAVAAATGAPAAGSKPAGAAAAAAAHPAAAAAAELAREEAGGSDDSSSGVSDDGGSDGGGSSAAPATGAAAAAAAAGGKKKLSRRERRKLSGRPRSFFPRPSTPGVASWLTVEAGPAAAEAVAADSAAAAVDTDAAAGGVALAADVTAAFDDHFAARQALLEARAAAVMGRIAQVSAARAAARAKKAKEAQHRQQGAPGKTRR